MPLAEVWTLQTRMLDDPPTMAMPNYGYPSVESAIRNGEMFGGDERAAHWRVLDPAGLVIASWDRTITFGPCPACNNWGVEAPYDFPPDELEQLIVDHDQEDHPGALPAIAEQQREWLQQLHDIGQDLRASRG